MGGGGKKKLMQNLFFPPDCHILWCCNLEPNVVSCPNPKLTVYMAHLHQHSLFSSCCYRLYCHHNCLNLIHNMNCPYRIYNQPCNNKGLMGKQGKNSYSQINTGTQYIQAGFLYFKGHFVLWCFIFLEQWL